MQYSQKIVNNQSLLYAWFPAMFTRVDILLVTEDSREDLIQITETIKTKIEQLESIANRFDENSEISRVNNTAYGNEIKISMELYQIIEECLLYNTKTLGYFDITINSTNKFTNGISNIQLEKTAQTIHFLHPDVKLDLSGFIKGYALGAIKKLLTDKKIDNALINIGNSSILAIGNHPNGNGWKIGIPDVNTSNECVLFNQCLTSSGNTKNTKWPIQKPKTRETIERSQILSIITDKPSTGEALSKALYIANDEERQFILAQLNGKIMYFN
jgi:thiamine biosynthesis lipoprotein